MQSLLTLKIATIYTIHALVDLFLAVLFGVTGLQVEALGYHLQCLSAALMNACLHMQI